MKKLTITILIIGMISLIAGAVLIQNYEVSSERKAVLDRAGFTEMNIGEFTCTEDGCPSICIPTIDNIKVCTNPEPTEKYCSIWLNESEGDCGIWDTRLRTDAQIQEDIDKLKVKAIQNAYDNQIRKESTPNVTHTFDGEINTITEVGFG